MGHIHRVRSAARSEVMRSAAASAALSLLFIVVYGGCSWVTAQRTDVGILFFEWERHIPFIPAMIVPYMSIDLFFVGAPFLCADREERRLLSLRISFAILAAGAFFLLMPFKFAFPRPVPDGWTGSIFRFLHGFDRPYNLFPSLHIALRTILADTYARHTKGVLRWTLHVWFSLIGFSTVLTYQHHVLDVVGGFALATLCFYLFRVPSEHEVATNRRIGIYYFAGAGLTLWLAILLWPWGALFLWSAISLGISGAAYFGIIPQVYRKEKGLLPLSTQILLAPVLLGHYVSLLYYKRQARSWDEIIPGVWLGRKLREAEAAHAIRQGVAAVLDVTAEFSEAAPFLSSRYRNIPVLDLTAPSQAQLTIAADFIRTERERGIVYVHCKIGYSRSAAVVGAYLLSAGIARSAEQAVTLIRKERPSLIVRPEVMSALKQFERQKSETIAEVPLKLDSKESRLALE